MNWLNEKENLETAINNGESYESIGRRYNVTGNYIKKIASKLGITLTQRRKINPNETFNKKATTKTCKYCGKQYMNWSKNTFCSMECASLYKKEEHYKYYLENQENFQGQTSMGWIKCHLLKEQNNKCAICGMENSWNNKPLVFILDHINGRANDNTRNNLRLVCPNCDSQLDTYKNKNKNSDRIYYHYNHR